MNAPGFPPPRPKRGGIPLAVLLAALAAVDIVVLAVVAQVRTGTSALLFVASVLALLNAASLFLRAWCLRQLDSLWVRPGYWEEADPRTRHPSPECGTEELARRLLAGCARYEIVPRPDPDRGKVKLPPKWLVGPSDSETGKD